MTYQAHWPSPIGELRIVVSKYQCLGLYFPDHSPQPRYWDPLVASVEVGAMGSSMIQSLADQLQSYFDGTEPTFQIECRFSGTEFQNQVWRHLTKIRPGQTQTYGEVAAAIGRPKAIRAVGAAVARNPISIVVPCHRVVGSGGKLTGFAGGLERKRFLLELERDSVSRT